MVENSVSIYLHSKHVSFFCGTYTKILLRHVCVFFPHSMEVNGHRKSLPTLVTNILQYISVIQDRRVKSVHPNAMREPVTQASLRLVSDMLLTVYLEIISV